MTIPHYSEPTAVIVYFAIGALCLAFLTAVAAAVAVWRARSTADARVAEAVQTLAAGMEETMRDLAGAFESSEPAGRADTPEQREFGDNLSFNPWRCLAAHRPLGGISRARRQVYQALSAFRHGRNQAPRVEPALGDKEWNAS